MLVIKALNPFKNDITVEIIHLRPSKVFLEHRVFLCEHPSKGGGNEFHGVHSEGCLRLQRKWNHYKSQLGANIPQQFTPDSAGIVQSKSQ